MRFPRNIPRRLVDSREQIRFAQEMSDDIYEMPAADRQRVRRKLKTWYEKAARELPWRLTQNPYRIWISEIMLQQTTVAAVIPYYERFFEAFPNLESLAKADEQQVLRQWEGLGYYSRARNIWKAARQIWEQSGGRFPSTVSELEKLAGIGRYTAGAIVSFAFNRKAPILEANTLRLYSRLLGYDGDPRSAEGQRILWQFAEDILPRTDPGKMNQALMDLGARICQPGVPDCPACPLRRECRAFAAGRQSEIPLRPERVALTDVTEASIAVRQGEGYLLRRRSEGERWAGLWDFPRFELAEEESILAPEPAGRNGRLLECRLPSPARLRLEEHIRVQTGIEAEVGTLLTKIRHGVTRFRIQLLCFHGKYLSGRPRDHQSIRWVPAGEFASYPLSTTGRKFADLLKEAE